MEFFVLPEELMKWIAVVLDDTDQWVLYWRIRPSTYYFIRTYMDLSIERFDLDNCQLFIGNGALRERPVMRVTKAGVERLDFRKSLCIQVCPSFISSDALVKGTMDILARTEYR